MKVWTFLLLAPAAIALVGCNSSEEPASPGADTVAAPQPEMTGAAVASVAADGTALEKGVWTITEDAAGARALYADGASPPSVSVQCDSANRAFSLVLAAAATAPEAWRLDAGGEAARIDMMPMQDGSNTLTADLDQGLAIIDALGEQGQVFTLTSPAGQPRQFPTHPGIRRVIASCS